MKDIKNKVFYNAKIFTADSQRAYADTMVVRDGKINWIGKKENLYKNDLDKEDLKGKRVLPGFIDAHMHTLFLARDSNRIACMPPNVRSIKELQVKLIERKMELNQGEWIEGWGYDEGKLEEGRLPTKHDLDQAVLDFPVVITRSCRHIVAVNSKALELAGIDKKTKDPEGGEIDRDAKGEPTGILREDARELIAEVQTVSTILEDAELLAEYSSVLFKYGITTITDAYARSKPQDYFNIYQLAQEKGLKQRTILYYRWRDIKNEGDFQKAKTNKCKELHIGGIKIMADGSVGGKTAWINSPYLGDENNSGFAITNKKELLEAAVFAKKNNIQLVVHAMGERAIDLVVNTFYNQEELLGKSSLIRIEHAAMPTKQALKKASKLNLIFVSQPIFIYAEIETYLKNLGHDRTKKTYPFKTILTNDIQLAFSSDAPATTWPNPDNPFVSLKSAVTRKAHDGTDTGQKEKIDLETALQLYTSRAQQVVGIPKIGKLKEGYAADFMVLDRDIFTIDKEEIDKIQIEKTYMKGELVYKK